jgi:aryl-alcohol dehydrogenase-like predicted oxidoreductase
LGGFEDLVRHGKATVGMAMMEYRRLGATGLEVSLLGFGCAQASGFDYGQLDEADWTRAARMALKVGINLFDTADIYGFGRVEELLARALGTDRHRVVVATKFGLVWNISGEVKRDSSHSAIKRALDASLRRLRLDAIPLYQLHWPDGLTPLGDIVATLRELQAAGKILHFGITNAAERDLCAFGFGTGVQSVQQAYNLFCRNIENGLLPWAEREGISVLAHSALARGLLAKTRCLGLDFGNSDTRTKSRYFALQGADKKQIVLDELASLAKQYGVSPATLALRWIAEEPRVSSVLVGVKTVEQLMANVALVKFRLRAVDRQKLSAVSAACPGVMTGELARKADGRED